MAAESEDRLVGGACWAITSIVEPTKLCNAEPDDDESWPAPVALFRKMFKPEGLHGRWWWNGGENDGRILALCFMAAMVEAGDA